MSSHRTLSFRSAKSSGRGQGTTGRPGLSFNSLRGNVQPELSRRLYKLIKSENNLINAHEAAGRERNSIATQLSEWGEQTGDEAISDISDKVGVILSEMGEQEDTYAHALDDSRGVLKTIRTTEKSVQPSRDNKSKIADEIAKLKLKEPQSAKLVVLEQELVRAEAENLVAEAQLTNITRQKLKEAYECEFAATIERAEKQIILAKHGRRLLSLLDDTPVVPGDTRAEYGYAAEARQILNDIEDDLREWRPDSSMRQYEVAAGGAAPLEEPVSQPRTAEARASVGQSEAEEAASRPSSTYAELKAGEAGGTSLPAAEGSVPAGSSTGQAI
jgi:hypothetical protein